MILFFFVAGLHDYWVNLLWMTATVLFFLISGSFRNVISPEKYYVKEAQWIGMGRRQYFIIEQKHCHTTSISSCYFGTIHQFDLSQKEKKSFDWHQARRVQAKASNWTVAAGSIKHEVCGYVCFCRSPSPSFLIWIPFTYIWISVKLSLTVDMLPHPVYQTSVFFVTLISQLPVLLNGIMINQSCQFPVLSSVQCNGYLGE